MIRARIHALSIPLTLLAVSLVSAGDLSTYREFQLGMKLPALVKLIGTPEARAIHQRPALIQELDWQPGQYPGSLPDGDPLKGIVFTFCNGELFRMVVNYDRYKTEGLTAEDMVESISAKYGTATRPADEMVFPSIYNETVTVIARWEDAEYSLNLVRSSYQPAFGMILYAKRLDAFARTAVTEAVRLDEQEAPQRETDRRRKQEDEERIKQEKARLVNKAGFRP